MQKKLFYENAYCREFSAKVLKCQQEKDRYEIVLGETAFYPEGGGQPADTGWLNENKVLDVKERNGEIIHICEKPLAVGTEVQGRLEWEKRFRHMQQHTGEHILSGIIHKKFGYDNVGFHMGKEFVSVDFNGPLTGEQIREAEEAACRKVFDNCPVSIYYPSAEELKGLSYRSKKELTGAVRIVEIADADICACCGTHVKQTGEVGFIKVTGSENYKGGVRLFLQIGWNAWEDYCRKSDCVGQVSVLLSAKPERVGEAVEKLYQNAETQKQQIIGLKQQLMECWAEKLPEAKRLCVFADTMEAGELRFFCDRILQERELVLVFMGQSGAYRYVLGKREGDIAQDGKLLSEVCGGKGGGKGNMVQGMLSCDRTQIERFAAEQWGTEICSI